MSNTINLTLAGLTLTMKRSAVDTLGNPISKNGYVRVCGR